MSKVKNRRILKKAHAILQEKLKIESSFRNTLKQYFSICKRALLNRQSIPSSKEIITANADKIIKILFKGHEDRTKILSKVQKSIKRLVNIHYQSIDRTSKDKWELSLQAAKEELNKINNPENKSIDLSYKSINTTAVNIFEQYSRNRIDNIAITEVSSIHNKARQEIFIATVPEFNDAIDDEDQDESDDLTDLTYSVTMEDANEEHRHVVIALTQKTWVALMDNATCDICAELDGQTVPMDQPFIAFGEEYFDVGDPHFGDRCDIII